MSIESGEGTSTSSGVIAVRSANSGATGVERTAGVQLGLGCWREQRRSVSRIWRGDGWSWRYGERQRGQWHERGWRRGERALGP